MVYMQTAMVLLNFRDAIDHDAEKLEASVRRCTSSAGSVGLLRPLDMLAMSYMCRQVLFVRVCVFLCGTRTTRLAVVSFKGSRLFRR